MNDTDSNNLQFLLDDSSLLNAEDELLHSLLNVEDELLHSDDNDLPCFTIHLPAVDSVFEPESNTSATGVNNVSTTEKVHPDSSTACPDESRFPVITNNDIEELKSMAVNKNTSRSTKQWLSVFKKWCDSRHLEIKFEIMAPADLDKTLTQFYAEVKKRDGDDYEPESLRIMQSALERHLKENNYPVSIVRSREFRNSQQTLDAKAISLRQQGKGKRPNKAQPITCDEESALWSKGQLGDHDGRVLTNTNFKNLTEQLGFRGRQEHHDSYVEDFVIRCHEDGSESVEFSENPTKTRSGGLRIKRRTSPQIMWSTGGEERDPVRLYKLWLSKRPDGMKSSGPLYLGIINRPKQPDIWYSKTRMGENSIGNIMKSMASCLQTQKKITNHSMRKTLVQKLKRCGQPRHVIKEITGHASVESLKDYDEIDEDQRKDLSHMISGYSNSNSNTTVVKTQQTEQQRPLTAFNPPLLASPMHVPVTGIQSFATSTSNMDQFYQATAITQAGLPQPPPFLRSLRMDPFGFGCNQVPPSEAPSFSNLHWLHIQLLLSL